MSETGCICDSEIPPGGFHESGCPLNPESVKDSGKRSQPGIRPWMKHQVCRDLAEGVKKRAEIAREHGVTSAAITKFARVHAREIDEIRAKLDDEFAGLWIASKTNRIAALEADYELTISHYKAGHHEWVKARTAIVHAVAEELGQLPNRTQLTIGGTVRHELVGVDLDECLPPDDLDDDAAAGG